MGRDRKPSPQTLAVLDALAAGAVTADAAQDAVGPGEWSHGYDLCSRLGIKAGTMYPILIRLAERGLVETAWERETPRGRPPRHLYRISLAGREYAERISASRTPDAAAVPVVVPRAVIA